MRKQSHYEAITFGIWIVLIYGLVEDWLSTPSSLSHKQQKEESLQNNQNWEFLSKWEQIEIYVVETNTFFTNLNPIFCLHSLNIYSK